MLTTIIAIEAGPYLNSEVAVSKVEVGTVAQLLGVGTLRAVKGQGLPGTTRAVPGPSKKLQGVTIAGCVLPIPLELPGSNSTDAKSGLPVITCALLIPSAPVTAEPSVSGVPAGARSSWPVCWTLKL